ncbi:MAG: hypothetical protein RLN81_12835 [Balneolaceae bacterium]
MGNDSIYSKKDISKILAKASAIQTQKDLYGDKEGLNEEELIAIAKEVGIDKDSLLQALDSHNVPEFDSTFKWLKGTSKIQDISVVDGEVSPELWEEIILEIRRITGGIGKTNTNGKLHEWEQRKQEIGYKHISLSQQNGKTKIQYVSNWTPLKYMSLMIPAFFGGILTLLLLKGIGMPKSTAVLFSPIGTLSGLLIGLSIAKSYFTKEKVKLKSILSSIEKKIKGSHQSKITIEEDAYSDLSNSTSSTNKVHS